MSNDYSEKEYFSNEGDTELTDQKAITDETVIGVKYFLSKQIKASELDEPYRTLLLNAKENEVKARAWDAVFNKFFGEVGACETFESRLIVRTMQEIKKEVEGQR